MARVGVTCERPDAPELEEYLAALRAAGAQPVVLVNDPARVQADLDGLDGVLVTGGDDIDPARYGAPRHPKTRELASPARDAYEVALVRAARERDVPLLAICRGAQVANVAFGGTLAQDVVDLIGRSVPHRRVVDGAAERGVLAEHRLTIAPDSRLRTLASSDALPTGSRHHQAIVDGGLAGDLRAVAHTADGVIEALEPRWPARFWLAVQWHPESTLDDGISRNLFAAFVRACRPARSAAGA